MTLGGFPTVAYGATYFLESFPQGRLMLRIEAGRYQVDLFEFSSDQSPAASEERGDEAPIGAIIEELTEQMREAVK